ncbi:c-type cytochrome [Caldimonas caldifontis]|uniref:Sulfide dehydrogenase n=1 Tax=Caldimonas caldifontis TaxID=1452508 RepID=A0A2S5SWU4_9BURK|nr:cytochrome c [Caldimonas caldifontis]PPE67214.1 sulfide dehydrogenase [Caldimonas caldifontis]
MSRFSLWAGAAALACFSLGAQASDADKLALGKQLFLKGAVPACAVCHALNDAGAEGAVGPSLDELRPDAERVAKAVRNGIGVMPAYDKTLSAAQIEALALYVATVTKR